MERTETRDGHERFVELCALAQAHSLSIEELADLERHLQVCSSCRQIQAEYAEIAELGMPFLAGRDVPGDEAERWDSRTMRQSLLSSIQRPHKVLSIRSDPKRSALRIVNRTWAFASLAACVLIAVALGAFHLGERKNVAPQQQKAVTPVEQKPFAPEDRDYLALLAAKTAQIAKAEEQIARGQQELARLRASSSLAEQQAGELGALNRQKEADLQKLMDERDRLAIRLNETEKAYASLQVDFANFKADHSRSLLRTASLEAELRTLQTASGDQERRLKDDEQYLVSDRDIRELMGARKLYIADVFDVDSVSHTRKPFGRVFYTESKSLVFYAFDLDRQPGVKNASVFQVWGQRDAETNGAPHPMNLGILYMDSETNRRWVLRSDDPKQLAEIDAVFVTVEPHGGSQKPTGKPLLYALLRKEANHP